jgi:nitrate/nitrite-specific signal transduction histidine kinase
MRQRAQLIGGRVELLSRQSKGTQVLISHSMGTQDSSFYSERKSA